MLDESFVDYFAECFTYNIDQCDWTIIFGVTGVFTWFGDKYHNSYFETLWVFACRKRVVIDFGEIDEYNFGEFHYLNFTNYVGSWGFICEL